ITSLRGVDFRFGKSPEIAEVVNAVDRYEALEAEYAARLAQIAADYGDIAAAHPIGILGAWTFDRPSVWPSDSIVGRIVAPAGATFGAAIEALPREQGLEVVISHEDIPALLSDVDIVFYNSFSDGSPISGVLEQIRDLEVFERLPAAQAGHV